MKWLSDDSIDRLRAAADAPDLTGTRYRLLEYLARGGMGTIYVAYDQSLERRVALKVLSLPDGDGELGRRLERESRILARLDHPGIVPVYETGTLGDGRPFYAMKLVEGQPLQEYAAATTSRQERLRVFLRISETVGFAHAQGVIHRDIKPDNVMVGRFGEVLVLDWGIAKVARGETSTVLTDDAPAVAPLASRSPSRTSPGAIIGTPGYMSPEQARGDSHRVDARSDVYALGAILRFLLSRSEPQDWTTRAFGTKALSTAPEGVLDVGPTGPLTAIAAKAMSEMPEQRYASAAEMARDVLRWLDGLPVLAYPESLLDRLRRIGSRHIIAIILILVYLFTRALVLLLART